MSTKCNSQCLPRLQCVRNGTTDQNGTWFRDAFATMREEADLTFWELHKLSAIANVEGDQRSAVAEAFRVCGKNRHVCEGFRDGSG